MASPPKVEIRVDGLYKAFAEQIVLAGIDMTVQRGDVLAIVGGSGCGKTVLLNHILGMLEPDAGRVRVADHDLPDAPLVDLSDLEEIDIARLHQHWGMVFQRNALFSGTVYDNLSLWLREVREMNEAAIRPIAEQALAAVALPAKTDFLERDVNDLSGGMAKRLAVARAISMAPKVIFYDEPTTGLDPVSSTQIHELIAATHENADFPRTTVIITHDKDLLRHLHPRIVMLNQGRVFFDGPLREFEASSSPIVRPYFDLMPMLHQRRRERH